MEKAAVTDSSLRRIGLLGLLALGFLPGCAAKVEKSGYQVGLEAISAAAATGSFEELESALETVESELDRDPADAQLWLLKANLLLRQIRLARNEPETWRLRARRALDALQQAIESAQPPGEAPDWVEPAAWVTAGDLLLIRADAAVGEGEPIPTELTRISFAEAAGHFHAKAHERVEALGRSASATAGRQQQNAFQGWYASRLRVAEGWIGLNLPEWSAPSAEELWRIQSKVRRIPDDFAPSGAAASLDPAHHRQSAQHAALAFRRTLSQETALNLAFEAYRGETLAAFFEDPGRFEPPPTRTLNDLGGELAASICGWEIDADSAISPAGFTLLITRPGEPWAGYSPPIRELTLRLGKSALRLELAAPTGPPRVSETGLRLELRSGAGVSGCVDPAPRGTCRRAEAYLPRPGALSALSDAALVEVEDGAGRLKAAAPHIPVRFPDYEEIQDRLDDFQTHVRRRAFDLSEARRMLWEVSELCPDRAGPIRHRCRLAVARGFAQLSPPEARLAQPVEQMLRDAHALAGTFQDPGTRAQALLLEIAFDLDFAVADQNALPASTESKLKEVRRILDQLPADKAEVYAYRLNALEAAYFSER